MIDKLKVQFCMTLFSIAAPVEKDFQKFFDKYYDGEQDQNACYILDKQSNIE